MPYVEYHSNVSCILHWLKIQGQNAHTGSAMSQRTCVHALRTALPSIIYNCLQSTQKRVYNDQ